MKKSNKTVRRDIIIVKNTTRVFTESQLMDIMNVTSVVAPYTDDFNDENMLLFPVNLSFMQKHRTRVYMPSRLGRSCREGSERFESHHGYSLTEDNTPISLIQSTTFLTPTNTPRKRETPSSLERKDDKKKYTNKMEELKFKYEAKDQSSKSPETYGQTNLYRRTGMSRINDNRKVNTIGQGQRLHQVSSLSPLSSSHEMSDSNLKRPASETGDKISQRIKFFESK